MQHNFGRLSKFVLFRGQQLMLPLPFKPIVPFVVLYIHPFNHEQNMTATRHNQWIYLSIILSPHGSDRRLKAYSGCQQEVVFGIEHIIMRSRGVTNSGTFCTRLLYNGDNFHLATDTNDSGDVNSEGKGCYQISAHDGSSGTEGGGIEVTVVNMYPRIFKLTLHSLKLVLNHHGISSGNNSMCPFISFCLSWLLTVIWF